LPKEEPTTPPSPPENLRLESNCAISSSVYETAFGLPDLTPRAALRFLSLYSIARDVAASKENSAQDFPEEWIFLPRDRIDLFDSHADLIDVNS
jgi:hypothetical protein